jgi:hypothetical protein
MLRSDPVNNEVLTVVIVIVLHYRGVDSPGRFRKWASTQIYGTCTDLYDDDIIPSVMPVCVPDGGEKRKVDFSGKRKAPSEVSRSCFVVLTRAIVV